MLGLSWEDMSGLGCREKTYVAFLMYILKMSHKYWF